MYCHRQLKTSGWQDQKNKAPSRATKKNHILKRARRKVFRPTGKPDKRNIVKRRAEGKKRKEGTHSTQQKKKTEPTPDAAGKFCMMADISASQTRPTAEKKECWLTLCGMRTKSRPNCAAWKNIPGALTADGAIAFKGRTRNKKETKNKDETSSTTKCPPTAMALIRCRAKNLKTPVENVWDGSG